MPAFLQDCRHWVFDMDGTLTRAVHDFQFIRQELEIPPEADILGYLDSLPADQACAAHAWLMEHERALAERSIAAPGAVELVQHLHQRGDRLAILTRNAQELARVTLQAIGLDHCFSHADILGREQAAPKPAPDGMLRIARNWQVDSSSLCMIGDFHFDLSSARRAGARAVLVNLPSNPWPDLSDYHAQNCSELLALLKRSCSNITKRP